MKLQINKEENWYICKFNFCKIQQLKHFDNAFAPQFDLYALKFFRLPKKISDNLKSYHEPSTSHSNRNSVRRFSEGLSLIGSLMPLPSPFS